MVSPVTFREPALLVKAVTTLDVLSGGRAWPGGGYQHEEAPARGLPMPPAAGRFERLGEALRIALAMWADSVVAVSLFGEIGAVRMVTAAMSCRGQGEPV